MKNRFSKTVLTLFLAIGTILPATAQEPSGDQPPVPEAVESLVLDLQGAVDYAIAYNISLQNARLELDRSEKSIWEAISQGLPQVDGTLDYMSYFNYEMEFNFGMDGGTSFTPDQLTQAFNSTQSVFPFYTTTDVAMLGANSYYEGQLQSMMEPSTITLKDASTATLQVSQLFFSGQYIVGIQTAKLARQIAGQSLENSELNTKETVITSYYLCLITEESLEIVEQNLENLEETYSQTEIMFRTGMAEQTDVDQIRVTVNQLDNARTSLERNLELNYNLLRFQLGLEPTVDVVLTDSLEALFISAQAESALGVPFEIENNITYQIMDTQEKINEKLVGLEQWNYAPTLVGFYNYNYKLLTTDFDMSPKQLAGVNLSVPIFSSGMRKARVDQAKINLNMAQNSKDLMIDQLNLQDKQLKYNLESSLENFMTQKDNVEVAQRVYDSYRRKFEQGMASSLDLTQANGNYLDAQSNYFTAVMEVLQAKLQIDKLMNTL